MSNLTSCKTLLASRQGGKQVLDADKPKILVCGGSLDIYMRLRELLKEKNVPVEVELAGDSHGDETGKQEGGCHGSCEMGPLVRIEPQDWLYTKVKLADCEEIVEKTILGGERVERLEGCEPHIGRKRFEIDPTKCKGCSKCARNCPVSAISGVIKSPFVIDQEKCIKCGACKTDCFFGAISIKNNDAQRVWDMINDPEVFVTCQIAPAVRVGIGQELGLADGENAMGQIVAALHRMGFDQVYDTATGADLTVIEESNEFVDRLENSGVLPLFTSCCPGWVQYVEREYPEMMPNVSTCRSPMSMFAAVLKEYYKDKLPEGKTKHFHVAIMPCVAKEFEANREEFKTAMGCNTDEVVTTQGLIEMIRGSGIVFGELKPETADQPFGTMSGAGVIFGVTGGVTEAVLRRVMGDNSETALDEIESIGVRGMENVKEFTVPFGGKELKIAVVSGLANAKKIVDGIKSGELHYDLVEVMACKGGCINGGGQPHIAPQNCAQRGDGLYRSDKESTIKRSQDNPLLKELYGAGGVLEGHKAHELLHVHYLKK